MTSYEETVANLKEAYAILCGGSEHYVGLSAGSAFRCQCAVKDALELLKEKEAVVPLCRWHKMFCGSCLYAIPKTANYCPQCGRKVKWND